MKEAFLQSIRDEFPNEQVTRLVFADWCFENLPELEHKLRTHFPIIDNLRIGSNFGNGHISGLSYESGSGYGYGFGSGYGYGIGSNGDGRGNGYYKGFGVGDGFGIGYGGASDYDNFNLKMPKLNRNQLIFLPFGFAFCGYVQEQLEPYVFKLTDASMIHFHEGNSNWAKVANNTNRNISSSNYGTITIGPQIFTSMDWEGDLPFLP